MQLNNKECIEQFKNILSKSIKKDVLKIDKLENIDSVIYKPTTEYMNYYPMNLSRELQYLKTFVNTKCRLLGIEKQYDINKDKGLELLSKVELNKKFFDYKQKCKAIENDHEFEL